MHVPYLQLFVRMTHINLHNLPPRYILGAILLLLALAHHVSALSNLNRIESMLLSSRLANIERAVETEFQSTVGPQIFRADADGEASCPAKDTRPIVTIIFPGAGGRDALSDELEDVLRRSQSASDDAFVTTFDWQENRGTVLTAAYDSEAVGETVARCLWDASNRRNDDIRFVHCVGISVGAFAANAMAREICQRREPAQGEDGPNPYVRLTLLAPFTSRGITGSSYGPDNFGRTADYAVQYTTNADPVPTTDALLPHCIRHDITSTRKRDGCVLPKGESEHCWPLAYYARHGVHEEKARFGSALVRHGDGVGLDRGTVVMVE